MLTQDVATTGDQIAAEINGFASLFELLSQIDQRLKDEDSEYREKYYPAQDPGKEG
ncbi:MAG: hypothetical protein HZA34_02000 [Candidatus Pacebacteria bacterium]|nr:hypothetical protein [Candidatus Paceibacterota bacterium]